MADETTGGTLGCCAFGVSIATGVTLAATGAAVLGSLGYEDHNVHDSARTLAIGMSIWSAIGPCLCGCCVSIPVCCINPESGLRTYGIATLTSYFIPGVFLGGLIGSAVSSAAGLATGSLGAIMADVATGGGVILAGAFAVGMLGTGGCVLIDYLNDRSNNNHYNAPPVRAQQRIVIDAAPRIPEENVRRAPPERHDENDWPEIAIAAPLEREIDIVVPAPPAPPVRHVQERRPGRTFQQRFDATGADSNEIPGGLVDPITLSIYEHPVVIPCGHSTEKSNLSQMVNCVCSECRTPFSLADKDKFPENFTLKKNIEDFIERMEARAAANRKAAASAEKQNDVNPKEVVISISEMVAPPGGIGFFRNNSQENDEAAKLEAQPSKRKVI